MFSCLLSVMQGCPQLSDRGGDKRLNFEKYGVFFKFFENLLLKGWLGLLWPSYPPVYAPVMYPTVTALKLPSPGTEPPTLTSWCLRFTNQAKESTPWVVIAPVHHTHTRYILPSQISARPRAAFNTVVGPFFLPTSSIFLLQPGVGYKPRMS